VSRRLIGGVAHGACRRMGSSLNQGKGGRFSRGQLRPLAGATALRRWPGRGKPQSPGHARLSCMENGTGAPPAGLRHRLLEPLCRAPPKPAGDPTGQYLLGLMYEQGPRPRERDDVLAYKWLNLPPAAARTGSRARKLSENSPTRWQARCRSIRSSRDKRAWR